MAQAKTRASTKRSQGSQKSQARSRSASSKSRTSSKSSNGNSASASRTQSKSRAQKSRAQNKPSTNGSGRVDSARRAVEEKAKGAGHAVGSVASKAKVPLMAGGAAIAGAAGGLALGVRQAHRRKGIGVAIPRRPQLKVDSHDLARAAKEVGSFGAQMGQLASELQRTREVANGSKRRSPVEVVLEGLTARRSRP